MDFFYCSQFHKEQNSRQPETPIMKGELLTVVKKFEFADASVSRNEQKEGSYTRRPLSSLPNPSPFFPSSLSHTRFDAFYAG